MVAIHYAIVLPYLGAVLTLAGTILAIAGRRDSDRVLAAGMLVLVLGWLAYMVPFVRLDYTLAEVARNANSDLPLSIRIATSWSGGGGSLYLYTTLIAASLLLVIVPAVRGRVELSRLFRAMAGTMVLVAFASAALNGAFDVNPKGIGGLGLNPLLKNYWIIPHPLTTFGGYALLLAGALIAAYTDRTLRGLGVFALGWSLLTLGIMFGAIWSYETFGWGGYWAWDPVEISELSVWLMATAALHMLGPLAPLRRGMLLAAASTALFAPFVTRSGLSPLHSFAAADIGSAILLVAGVALLALAIHDISQRVGSIRFPLKPGTPSELAATSIGLAGIAITLMAFFVYASLLVPGVLNVLGKQATVPTMRQGVEFYHPVLLPVFLFSLVWLPGYFLSRQLGVKGFAGLVVTELALSAVLVLAVRRGSIDLLPGAPPATKIQVATALPVAAITLAAILVSLAAPLVRRANRRATSLRDLGLKLLHTGMLVAFIGVLISGTYAFNDKFFETYTVRPGDVTDTGLVKLSIEGYKYTVYNGTIDLKHHMTPKALTAAAAWLGLRTMSMDIASAVQEVSYAESQVEANKTLQDLTRILVNNTTHKLGNISLEGTASLSTTNFTARTTHVIAENTSVTLNLTNTTLILTITPTTDQNGGLTGAWIVSGMQAEKLVLDGASLSGVRLGFHSPLQVNFSSPVNLSVPSSPISFSIRSVRVYPAGNTSTITIKNSTTTINGGLFIEIANATLRLESGSIRIPVPAGPGYYLLVALERGDVPELEKIMSCTPLARALENKTLMGSIVGPRTGELPLLPSSAPSGVALDLHIRADTGGKTRMVSTRIRFEANGEAMGIHGLVTPAILLGKGLGDIYISVHPPMVKELGESFHEPLVKYINYSIRRLPAGQALTLAAVMASGFQINTISSMDANHIGFLVERSTAALYLAAENNTDAVKASGVVVMVKYVPGVRLVWAGVTLMALTGFLLSALYLKASRRA